MTVRAAGHGQALQRAEALLAHLAPMPPALDERLAPRLQPRPHGVRAQGVQLPLFRREMRLAGLQLALRGGELRADLHLGLDEAERRGRARGREDGVACRFLALGGFN